MIKKRGTLKYSTEDKSWYILLENNEIQKSFPHEEIIDADIKLSDFFIPCAINFKEGTVNFPKAILSLNDCFEYDIEFYQPWRTRRPMIDLEGDFEVPF